MASFCHRNDAPADWVASLAAARAGSAEALGRLFQQFRPYLLAIAAAELDADLTAKVAPSDLVQETFLEGQRDFAAFRGDQPEERPLPERLRGSAQISHVPSCCTGAPSSSIRVPGIRRSLTMSQWMRDSFVPPMSGRPFPSARCTVPSIFSSKRMFFM